MNSQEMPKYKCHKSVWALKIKNIYIKPAGGATITPEEDDFSPFDVEADYVSKHQPENGGYYVLYPGGYKSYSPADAFEDGYVLI
ncbi:MULTISPECIES: hypothetical protein [unclassified Neptuniibacter]|uniref:hypothetical protein n=1 Tax=unclassified Neptuniibacter TaxID=2630693 RepID=UPI000C444D31|nr:MULTISPECIES: hypothetical protein [unclassified Neptuniibacter]MAY41702.1 hypothetical protein [Oceanospirillaceae bacterium]|tara:strand:- start:8365 stop:8619 length:255 start_codon:yes stop_codon:yes gene_type:complete